MTRRSWPVVPGVPAAGHVTGGYWHPGQPDEIDGPCVRCGEWTTPDDRAEVADGLVHAQCMRPGEEIA
jgi:hypothetical protein